MKEAWAQHRLFAAGKAQRYGISDGSCSISLRVLLQGAF
jgi:hypothetical protein